MGSGGGEVGLGRREHLKRAILKVILCDYLNTIIMVIQFQEKFRVVETVVENLFV